MDAQSLDRRDALKRLAMGGVAVATLPTWVDTLCAVAVDHAHAHGQRKAGAAASAWTPKILTPAQNETVITISELIIPQTKTPGAKAAKVNEFIDGALAQARQTERDRFLEGLAWIDRRARADFSTTFVAATPEQQTALLTSISTRPTAGAAATTADKTGPEKTGSGKTGPDRAGADRAGSDKAGTDKAGTAFFDAIKSLTIVGYYTSEVGVREELGDDGTLFFAEFKGCTHPEHQDA